MHYQQRIPMILSALLSRILFWAMINRRQSSASATESIFYKKYFFRHLRKRFSRICRQINVQVAILSGKSQVQELFMRQYQHDTAAYCFWNTIHRIIAQIPALYQCTRQKGKPSYQSSQELWSNCCILTAYITSMYNSVN